MKTKEEISERRKRRKNDEGRERMNKERTKEIYSTDNVKEKRKRRKESKVENGEERTFESSVAILEGNFLVPISVMCENSRKHRLMHNITPTITSNI